MPSKSWFSVQASAANANAGTAADVAIRGYIGEWGITDRDFITALEAFGPVEQINVSINSRGGEVDHALSIFNHLKSHPAQVAVRIDGVAMSAASIIAMAGDEIIMPANTVMMVHNPWTFAAGDAKALRKTADDLETFEAALLQTYVARTGKSEADIQALLDAETFMTAAEAVEQGFADRVEPLAKHAAASASAVAYASALGIPEEVLARAAAQAEAGAEDDADPDAVTPDAVEPPPLPASLASQIAAAAELAGLGEHAACFALDTSITDMPSALTALSDAREIVDLCAIAGKPEMASALIRKRADLAAARIELLAARADDDEAAHTDGTLPSHSSKPSHSASQAVSTQSIWAARVSPTRQ